MKFGEYARLNSTGSRLLGCGAGTLACSAETHLGVDAFAPAAQDAVPPPRSRLLECPAISG